MTTIEQGQISIPSGTWAIDPVHSSVGFAVRYTGTITFRGEFGDCDATLADGSPALADDVTVTAHLGLVQP